MVAGGIAKFVACVAAYPHGEFFLKISLVGEFSFARGFQIGFSEFTRGSKLSLHNFSEFLGSQQL